MIPGEWYIVKFGNYVSSSEPVYENFLNGRTTLYEELGYVHHDEIVIFLKETKDTTGKLYYQILCRFGVGIIHPGSLR